MNIITILKTALDLVARELRGLTQHTRRLDQLAGPRALSFLAVRRNFWWCSARTDDPTRAA
jgi:hypothetical protein